MIRVVFLLWAAAVAVAAAPYTVTVIPPPSGFTNVTWASINNAGQVAGYGYNAKGAYQAVIGSPSGSGALPLTGFWSESFATGINSSGQVAGYGNDYPQAFIATPEGSSLIPNPGSPYSISVQGLNDAGQVVGNTVNAQNVQQAFIGTPSGSTLIPLPPGCTTASGYAINSSAQVTGICDGGGPAFIGTVAGSTLIPFPPGVGTSLAANSINDSGQVAGAYVPLHLSALQAQAFVGTLTGVTPIPLPAGAGTARAVSINNAGVVVGHSDAGPWIWSLTAGIQLLNTQMPAGWGLEDAYVINKNGVILALATLNGGGAQYVELVPAGLNPSATPVPSTVVLGGLGLLLVVLWRVRTGSLA